MITNRDKTTSYSLDTLYRVHQQGCLLLADFHVEGTITSGVILCEYQDEKKAQQAMNDVLLQITRGSEHVTTK